MNCQNGGRCAEDKGRIPLCYCPNGWGGPFCESGHLKHLFEYWYISTTYTNKRH